MTLYPLLTTETFDPDAVWAFAKARGAREPFGQSGFTLRYLKALKADAATLGISGRWMLAQWDLETGNPSNGNGGQSAVWVSTGNPGGIAVFPDGSTWGLTFTPETAARAQVTHMARYLDLPGVPADWIATDARWNVPEMVAMVGDVTYVQDLGGGRWATDDDYADALIGRYTKYFGAPGKAADTPSTSASTTGDTAMATITYGRVPKPAAKQIDTSRKPEGTGWNNLGKRKPLFVVLHRMVGSLAGTDSWFAEPSVQSLTDFGIGIAATDGTSKSGELHQYNDPTGYRSGWASGPVSSPYGDAAILLAKYVDKNICNINGVSLEISGNYDTPITDSEKQRIAEFMAYWWDYMKIPYTSAPINPETGASAVTWHQEWTIGTGKSCPGAVVMNATNDLIARATAILKQYQTGDAGDGTGGDTDPIPETPTYAIPQIPSWLTTWKGEPVLHDVPGVKDGTVFATTAQYKAVRDTPRLQYATSGAKKVGPDIKAGEMFPVAFIFTAADGKQYGVTKYGTRVLLSDLEVISDAAEAA